VLTSSSSNDNSYCSRCSHFDDNLLLVPASDDDRANRRRRSSALWWVDADAADSFLLNPAADRRRGDEEKSDKKDDGRDKKVVDVAETTNQAVYKWPPQDQQPRERRRVRPRPPPPAAADDSTQHQRQPKQPLEQPEADDQEGGECSAGIPGCNCRGRRAGDDWLLPPFSAAAASPLSFFRDNDDYDLLLHRPAAAEAADGLPFGGTLRKKPSPIYDVGLGRQIDDDNWKNTTKKCDKSNTGNEEEAKTVSRVNEKKYWAKNRINITL
jgi:hypothetical protein